MRMPLLIASGVAGCAGLLAVTQLAAQRPPPPQASRGGTGLVDVSVIMKHSARFNQSMDRLKQEYESKALELKKEGERGNQLTEELRKMPANSPERKQLEQQVLKARADYELKGKKVTEDIRDNESKIVLGMMGDLKGELERYARANGVQLILRNDPTPPELTDPRMILQEIHKPIVYQSGADVTPAILEAMNRGVPAAARTGRAAAPSGGVPSGGVPR
ncbi:MAG: OmpH family outer membrane protein [Pirellulales bacterium]